MLYAILYWHLHLIYFDGVKKSRVQRDQNRKQSALVVHFPFSLPKPFCSVFVLQSRLLFLSPYLHRLHILPPTQVSRR